MSGVRVGLAEAQAHLDAAVTENAARKSDNPARAQAHALIAIANALLAIEAQLQRRNETIEQQGKAIDSFVDMLRTAFPGNPFPAAGGDA
jgi:hypothetical protein